MPAPNPRQQRKQTMNKDLHSPQVLCRAADEFEAGAIITALGELGIHAMAVGGYTAGFIAEAPGDVSVLVSQQELKAAQAALQEIQKSQKEIDWSKVDVGQPESE